MSSCYSSTIAKDKSKVPKEKPWITSLEGTMIDYSSNNNLRLTCNEFPTIFRVPNHLHSHDPKAYGPAIVSLGPYHHHCIEDHLQPLSINKLKLYYLNKFLQRNLQYCLTDYIKMIKCGEKEVRATYSEEVNMSSDYFVRMMLLDCCFVLEIISSINQVMYPKKYRVVMAEAFRAELLVNPILGTRDMSRLVIDMLILENQLPFFLLEHLFSCVYEKENFLDWVLSHFPFPKIWTRNKDSLGEVYHFLHLFHSSIAPPALNKQDNNVSAPEMIIQMPSIEGEVSDFLGPFHSSMAPPAPGMQENNGWTLDIDKSTSDKDKARRSLWVIICDYFYKVTCMARRSLPEDNGLGSHMRAMRLMEAGVNFEKSEKNNFLCITFDEGMMKIPTLQVDDYTNILFRNLIAFEQCYYKSIKTHYQYHHMGDEKKYVMAYASFMNCFINTEADVNLLLEKKIICNRLENGKEVACLFNNLCKVVQVDDQETYLSNVYKSVNEYCKSRRGKWKAKLIKWKAKLIKWKKNFRDDYFSSPWAGMAWFGALVLFLLTGAQTIYTVLSYYYK